MFSQWSGMEIFFFPSFFLYFGIIQWMVCAGSCNSSIFPPAPVITHASQGGNPVRISFALNPLDIKILSLSLFIPSHLNRNGHVASKQTQLVPAAAWQALSCSRYQLQICMLPLLSSMHFVKFWAAPAQLLYDCSWGAAAWAWTGAGAGSEEPPEKRPPMAWPTEEPMATPL